MSTVKKQHYVPQFYLQRFANSNLQTNVYDKFQQKSFVANIRDIASSNYFYDLSQESIKTLEELLKEREQLEQVSPEEVEKIQQQIKDVQVIEKYLSKTESYHSEVLNDFIDLMETRKIIRNKYRPDLAMFMAVQFLRTNQRREAIKESEQLLEQKVMELVKRFDEVKGTSTTAADLGIAYDANEAELRHKMFLFDTDFLDQVVRIFLSHIWVIGVNESSIPLYTSDHPVAIREHKHEEWRSNSGLASPGVEIMLPLSPQYILVLAERSYFRNIEHRDGKFLKLNGQNVIHHNSCQVYDSYRQIYSISDNFELVEEMLEKEPELKEPISRVEST